MEETIFPSKMRAPPCGIPVRMMINLSMRSILLSLLLPFCPSRAEEQLAGTGEGAGSYLSSLFFKMDHF